MFKPGNVLGAVFVIVLLASFKYVLDSRNLNWAEGKEHCILKNIPKTVSSDAADLVKEACVNLWDVEREDHKKSICILENVRDVLNDRAAIIMNEYCEDVYTRERK